MDKIEKKIGQILSGIKKIERTESRRNVRYYVHTLNMGCQVELLSRLEKELTCKITVLMCGDDSPYRGLVYELRIKMNEL